MSDELVRGAAPPTRKHVLEIRRVKSSEVTTYVCFSESVFGQLIHWWGNRSHECVADKKKVCNGCQRGWPSKWLGYVHVMAWGEEQPCFLELTSVAVHKLITQVPKGKNLRGLQFRIRKTKGGAKGRFIIDVMERRADTTLMQQERDPYEVLQFLWSCKRPVKEPGME